MNPGKQGRGLTANKAEQEDDQQFFIIGDGRNMDVGKLAYHGRCYEDKARRHHITQHIAKCNPAIMGGE